MTRHVPSAHNTGLECTLLNHAIAKLKWQVRHTIGRSGRRDPVIKAGATSGKAGTTRGKAGATQTQWQVRSSNEGKCGSLNLPCALKIKAGAERTRGRCKLATAASATV